MTVPDPSNTVSRPTMAMVHAEATARIVRVLREMGEADLAEGFPDRPFHGRCRCRPGCAFVLTAPPGESSSLMVWLEVDGDIVGEAGLDRDGRYVTNIEIGDPRVLGLPWGWYEHA